MINKIINLKHQDIIGAAQQLSLQIKKDFTDRMFQIKIYPVPRGGIPCVYILIQNLPINFHITDYIAEADIIIDDIEDSGLTKIKMLELNPKAKFYTLFNSNDYNEWLSFPFERTLENKDVGIEQELLRISEFLRIDVNTIKMKLDIISLY